MAAPAETLPTGEINKFYYDTFDLMNAPEGVIQFAEGWRQRDLMCAPNLAGSVAKSYLEGSAAKLREARDQLQHDSPNSPFYARAELAVVYTDSFRARHEGRMPTRAELAMFHPQLVNTAMTICSTLKNRSVFPDERTSTPRLMSHTLGLTLLTRTLDPEYFPWLSSPREQADGDDAVAYFNQPGWGWSQSLPVAMHHERSHRNQSAYPEPTAHVILLDILRQSLRAADGTALHNMPSPTGLQGIALDALVAENQGSADDVQKQFLENATLRVQDAILEVFPNNETHEAAS